MSAMDNKDQIIAELRQTVAELTALVQQQAEEIRTLKLQLAKAQKNSANSSKPPSTDLIKPKQKQKKPGRPKKRKRGAQPGHQRHLRELLPEERVDHVQEYEILDEEIQRLGLIPSDQFERIQHIELPESPLEVTEHRLRIYHDPEGQAYIPHFPELIKGPIFGPRLLAMIDWLKSEAHASYTTIEAWMEDVLQVPVSRGYLTQLCTKTISESLQDAHQELEEALVHQSVLGSDETSFKNNGKKHWIWCISATMFSFFYIAPNRSREVLETLVGPEFQGYFNFDYFSSNSSFVWRYDIQAQFCWAHLIRDIRFLTKHPDDSTRIWAEQLFERSRRLFSAWHRRETMTAEGRERSFRIHRERFLMLVRNAPDSSEAENLAARFEIVSYTRGDSKETHYQDLSKDYFRFLEVDGLEPTNNHSEQQIRHCVIDRLITQGTRGEAGQRYHERMWTAIATCRKQGRSFYQFLCDSIEAKLNGEQAPSLLPA